MPLVGRRKRRSVLDAFVEHASTLDSSNAIVAAATRMLPDGSGAPFRINNTAWSQEAWRQYDVCGELHFATSWLASAVSRCRLIVADKLPDGTVGAASTKNTEVLDLLGGLIAHPEIQAELLRMETVNLTIVGDSYILGEPNVETGAFDRWTVLSIQELVLSSTLGFAMVNIGDGKPRRVELDEVLLMRVHRPHPRRWWEADSPTRAALPILRELEELSKYLFATINSRLSGAGILGMPSEMTFPQPAGEIQPGQSAFMSFLTEAMLAPIEDMSNPGAVVPIVIEAPKESLAGIEWITNPNSQLPAEISLLRERALQRLALSLDLAPDTLFGTGNASRWGQWTIEEQSIKHHIEPIMILICSALDTGWAAPTLKAAGIDPDAFAIWYDASDLVQKVDQGSSALDVYDRGELNGAALRRETGFEEADAPAGKEAEIKALLKIVTLAPQVANIVLPELAKLYGIEVDLSTAIAPDPAGGTPPVPTAPARNPNPRQTTPTPPKAPSNPPRKDGRPGEPQAA